MEEPRNGKARICGPGVLSIHCLAVVGKDWDRVDQDWVRDVRMSSPCKTVL